MNKYTICFIKQDSKVLLLNRENPRWMGRWNGIGGKIEQGETPDTCVLREVYEETGIKLTNVIYKGTINTIIDNEKADEIYAFISEISKEIKFKTPIKSSEGILDWKELSWILHPQNTGVAEDIAYFFPTMLLKDEVYEHQCIFNKNSLIGFSQRIISNN